MYKSPRTIALDLEGVVAKSQERVIQLFNASDGAMPAHNGMLRNYDMTQFLRYTNGEHISREQLLGLFAEAWKNPRRIMMVDDNIPTILDGLDSWKILIATTTAGNPDNVSKFFEMNRITVDRIKFFETEEEKIKAIVSNSDMRAYVDDNPAVALKVAEAGKLSFCLNIYSRNVGRHKNLTTVRDWEELQIRLLRL
ncbi:MAG: hypothetical protein ABSE71_00275 [Candidatus Micrarchaeaceae archaeon]|jgi:hypothetical protein|nr:hypothetical protein [Candidatus Micrarchaeota archaeon]HII09871.1 hypothetical protein [Candidatus Micrarchaeota archaeon]